MTVAAAKARGFAVAAKGTLGWQASCPTCPWTSPISVFAYKGDAATAAADHNRKYHPERTASRIRTQECHVDVAPIGYDEPGARPHWSLTDDKWTDLPARFMDPDDDLGAVA